LSSGAGDRPRRLEAAVFERILLAVDLAHLETQQRVAETAARMARHESAELRVMTVIPDFGMSIVETFFPSGYEDQAIVRARKQLKAFAERVVGANLVTSLVVRHGTIYREIIDVADKTRSDLILLAASRPELSDYLLGPNAARVVRHARQSVLVVRD
jgi:nucleotide-binding universal stress UspA family protein